MSLVIAVSVVEMRTTKGITLATKRPLDSGARDSLGRTIRVSGDQAVRADAPPPVETGSDAPKVELTEEEWVQVWEVVSDLAPKAASKWSEASADEVASQAMLGIGALRERGEVFDDPSSMRAYLYVVCRNAAFQIHNEARSGIRSTRWRQARAALARMTDGQRLNQSEIDELASTVTVSGHRLPQGWQHWGSVTADMSETDIPETGFEDHVVDRVDADAAGGVDADVVDGIYAGSKWATTAMVFGAPKANEGILSENTAINVRKMMAKIGGIEAAMKAWDDDEIDVETERALFAPFGKVVSQEESGFRHFWPRWSPPSFEDQERIVDTLRRVDSHANEAWSSALSDATYLVERTTRKVPHKPKTVA